MYRPTQDWDDREVRTGVQNVIMRLEPDIEKQITALQQVAYWISGAYAARLIW